MSQTDNAYNKAINVLEACSKPTSFYASGLKGGYEATWARDSMTCALGASLVGEKFKKPFKDSLELLAKNQTELGLIPNCVGSYNIERQSDVTFNSIDAPLWYIIGHFVYEKAYQDDAMVKKYRKNIEAALSWLKHQDPNNDKLIVNQPTGDWMDAFPHKYGRVMHNLALYFAALKMSGEIGLAEYIQRIINGEIQKYLSLYDEKLGYYRPWAWKDHAGDKETEDWFDSAANLLAVITGLATPKIAKNILAHIKKEKIDQPFPCKAIWPPIKRGDPAWKPYFERCDAREPYHYLNGGIWPWIGGLYVTALVKVGDNKAAENALENLAKANLKTLQIRDMKQPYEFNEWLDGKTGEAKGEPYQAWSAGMYVYAYECVKKKRVLFF